MCRLFRLIAKAPNEERTELLPTSTPRKSAARSFVEKRLSGQMDPSFDDAVIVPDIRERVSQWKRDEGELRWDEHTKSEGDTTLLIE